MINASTGSIPPLAHLVPSYITFHSFLLIPLLILFLLLRRPRIIKINLTSSFEIRTNRQQSEKIRKRKKRCNNGLDH